MDGTPGGGIHWVIAGGESGPRRRSTNPDWLRSLRDQCAAAGVPFFLKQADLSGRIESAPVLDGRQWLEFPPSATRLVVR
jgi:protein gp37